MKNILVICLLAALCSCTPRADKAAAVAYEIRPYGAVGEGTIPRTMHLEKIDGSWKIVSLE